MGTLKEEHVDYTEYHDFRDACQQLKQWLDVDDTQLWMRSMLGDAPPAEYEAAFWDQSTRHLLSVDRFLCRFRVQYTTRLISYLRLPTWHQTHRPRLP